MSLVVEVVDELRGTVLATILGEPEKLFNARETVVLKDHRRTAVARAVLDHRVIYLKRFKAYSWYQRVETAVIGSRARGSRKIAHELKALGFETPAILGVIEGRLESWLVMEGVEDGRPGGDLWLEEALGWPPLDRLRLLAAGAHFLRRFHDTGFYSRDTNANNFLVMPTGNIVLLDLENIRRLGRVSRRRRIKNLVQLYRIVRGHIRTRELIHFVREYLDAGSGEKEAIRSWLPALRGLDAAKEVEYRRRALRGTAKMSPPVEFEAE